MAATWPATLPAPLLDGYAAAAGPLVSRPDFGAGFSAPQRLAEGMPSTVTATWALTREQTRDLIQFVRDHADEWFQISLIRPDAANPATVHARIEGDPAITALGAGHDRVTLQLRTQPI